MAVDQSPDIAAAHAKLAGLRYVYDHDPGIGRKRQGKIFAYYTNTGKKITQAKIIARCQKLAIPPAWRAVWICRDAQGHLQATGLDARGRKQYRYHADWRIARDRTKFQTMAEFGAALPIIRRQVTVALTQDSLSRERVIAAIVRLLDRTGLRVGNDAYMAENHTHGLTTISKKHVKLHGQEIELDFPAKGSKIWHGTVLAPHVAKVIHDCEDIPGYRLFKFRDSAGKAHVVGSGDVNGWLQEISRQPHITAKDFRTWHACVLFIEEACKTSSGEKLPPLKKLLKTVSAQLGNTPAILQKSYVHPNLIDLYRSGAFQTDTWQHGKSITGLHKTEAIFWRWLQKQYGSKRSSPVKK